jgi:radical SAM protein with 4Fe4S-binding SPASM domain
VIAYSPHPIALQVELTNHCPYTCLGCPRTDGMQRALGMISWDTFGRVIEAVRSVQRQHAPLALHHMGESLLHPQIADFIRHATRRGVPTAIACRPNHLTPRRARAVLEAGVAILVVSLDGMETSTLRTITGRVADFDGAEANIEALLEAKRALGSPALVQLQMIAYRENEHQWASFLERFRFADPTVTAALKRYSTWTVPELARHGSREARFLGGTCTRPLWSFTVLWDGRIVPCNRDHDGEVVLGNIHDGLDAVWNGAAYQEFRRRFDGDLLAGDHLCRKCALYPWGEKDPSVDRAADPWFGSDRGALAYSEAWWLEHWGHLVGRA